MTERIICFSLGLSPGDIEKGKASYCEAIPDACDLEVIAVTESMLDSQVGEVLDSLRATVDLKDAKKEWGDDKAVSPEACKYKVVVVNTMERQQVLPMMRSFKAILPDPQNLIFAVITDTARSWTFADYIGHLAVEHEEMSKR